LKIPKANICFFYWIICDFAVDYFIGLHYKLIMQDVTNFLR